jgi:hypothetical protein
MPIQIRVMSWNIQKKQTNARFIAGLMRAHQIDICALLEVPNSQAFAIPFSITTELRNLNPPYHQYDWDFASVDVGDEAVAYIWHQNATVGPNAFQAEPYVNNPGGKVRGKVMKDAGNATIYFPTTQFNWASLPGKPAGRRPAFMSFLTNDGQAARRFTVLGLHAPFNVDTSIQSYSAHLYASSREITLVERMDADTAALQASLPLAAALAGSVDPLLAGVIANHALLVQPAALRTAAVAKALAAIKDTIDTDGTDLPLLFSNAVNEGIGAALNAIGAIPASTLSGADAASLARACAMAGAVAATSLVAAIQVPTAPGHATASAAAAAVAAQAAVTGEVSQYVHPLKKSPATIRSSISTEAKRMARAALAPFTFAALPQVNVDASIVAGDFNVHYPDSTAYLASQRAKLGGGNAYTALAAVTSGARNAASSTRIGPTAFRGQRVYSLKNPAPIQSNNSSAPNFVPLDISSLIKTPASYMGYGEWRLGLQSLPRPQNVSWAQLVAGYSQALDAAFDTEVINDTSFYRANCYDNIFVRGGANIAGGTIDVMSELGSWGARLAPVVNPQPGLAPNPWNAAAGGLNAPAQAQLGQVGANLQFTYNTTLLTVTYTITPALADAEDAAVFFDQFISDHLPVYVQVQI